MTDLDRTTDLVEQFDVLGRIEGNDGVAGVHSLAIGAERGRTDALQRLVEAFRDQARRVVRHGRCRAMADLYFARRSHVFKRDVALRAVGRGKHRVHLAGRTGRGEADVRTSAVDDRSRHDEAGRQARHRVLNAVSGRLDAQLVAIGGRAVEGLVAYLKTGAVGIGEEDLARRDGNSSVDGLYRQHIRPREPVIDAGGALATVGRIEIRWIAAVVGREGSLRRLVADMQFARRSRADRRLEARPRVKPQVAGNGLGHGDTFAILRDGSLRSIGLAGHTILRGIVSNPDVIPRRTRHTNCQVFDLGDHDIAADALRQRDRASVIRFVCAGGAGMHQGGKWRRGFPGSRTRLAGIAETDARRRRPAGLNDQVAFDAVAIGVKQDRDKHSVFDAIAAIAFGVRTRALKRAIVAGDSLARVDPAGAVGAEIVLIVTEIAGFDRIGL